MEKVMGYLALFGLTALFLGMGIYSGVIEPLRCSEKIEATFKGIKRGYKGASWPIFSFRKDGKVYENATVDQYYLAQWLIKRRFKEGLKYEIYINPKKPMMMRSHRRIGIINTLIILIGVMCMWVFFENVGLS